jgi:hypothetical protein
MGQILFFLQLLLQVVAAVVLEMVRLQRQPAMGQMADQAEAVWAMRHHREELEIHLLLAQVRVTTEALVSGLQGQIMGLVEAEAQADRVQTALAQLEEMEESQVFLLLLELPLITLVAEAAERSTAALLV